MGLRIAVYDETTDDVLEASWVLGARLYRLRRDLDAVRGVSSLSAVWEWLPSLRRPVVQLQFWCHGDFGAFGLGGEWYGAKTAAEVPDDVRRALAPDAVVWWRTCRTFSSRAGQHFASAWAEALGRRVAGHTHDISLWHSGLWTLAPGQAPAWSLLEGNTRHPSGVGLRARPSRPWAPRTIFCTTGTIPRGW